jgi:hypothetical protein
VIYRGGYVVFGGRYEQDKNGMILVATMFVTTSVQSTQVAHTLRLDQNEHFKLDYYNVNIGARQWGSSRKQS